MALPISGAISFTDIQTEFGGTNPIGLNEYYRGGGLVPNTPANTSIPTTGAISLSDFYGGSVLTISTHTVTIGTYTSGTKGIPSYGYDDGTITSGIPTYGSLDDYTYGSITIRGIYWSGNIAIKLVLDGALSNSDSVFTGIVIDGNTYPRTAPPGYMAVTYEQTPDYTSWHWPFVDLSETSTPYPNLSATSGTVIMTIE